MLSATIRRKLKRRLTRFEGRIPHMYLDTNGHVTLGVGHFLGEASDAEPLAFETSAGRRATPREIRDEYDTVSQLDAGEHHSYYEARTTLRLPDEAIDRLTNQHIDTFHRELRRNYSNFSCFPEEAQLALFDMIFNMGLPTLRREWPKMNAAIREQDWTTAAQESRRSDVGAARNRYVRKLFERAADGSR